MIFLKGFIKDTKLLDENHRAYDLLDLSDEIERISQKIKGMDRSSIFGFIGKFGTGKTTLLNQLKIKH